MKSIGVKIGAGYVLALVFLVVIGIVSYRTLAHLDESIGWVDHTNDVIKVILSVDEDLVNAETGMRGFVITGEESYLEPYNLGLAHLREHLDHLREVTSDNPVQQKRLDTLEPLVADELAEMKVIIDTRKNKGFEPALAHVLDNEGKIIMDKIRAVTGAMHKEEDSLLGVRAAEQKADIDRTVKTIFSSVFIAFVVLLGVSVLITRNISRPLKSLTDVAERISEGNVGAEIAVEARGDEVGLLADSFRRLRDYIQEMAAVAEEIAGGDLNGTVTPRSDGDTLGHSFVSMLESLREQVNEMRVTSQALSAATKEISTTTTQFSASASETSTSVTETTTSVEETSQIASQVSDKTREISDRSGRMEEVSDSGKKATADTIEAMDRIKDQMNLIADSIVGLSEQTQAIGEIINAVEDLSEQSNLLAVNASIEAAKVGEQGKGFAVVAHEIKSLAEQSKEATGRVRKILTDIQKAATSSVMVTEQGAKAVSAGVDQSRTARDAIGAMADNIQEFSQASMQINVATKQQQAGMEQIAQAMQSIDVASKQNVAGAKQLQDAAENLEKLGERLTEVVEKYRLEG